MSRSKRPLNESYWVEKNRLLAGEYPAGETTFETRLRLRALLEAGLDTFIDLTRPGELQPYQDVLTEEAALLGKTVTCHRFPIGDFGLPSRAQMGEILVTIDSTLAAGHKVYLHCWGGIGRTGTTVGCYLVRHGKNGTEALQQLAEWWREVPKNAVHPRSPETEAQRQFILTWHELA